MLSGTSLEQRLGEITSIVGTLDARLNARLTMSAGGGKRSDDIVPTHTRAAARTYPKELSVTFSREGPLGIRFSTGALPLPRTCSSVYRILS